VNPVRVRLAAVAALAAMAAEPAPAAAAEHLAYATGAMLYRALSSGKPSEQGIARGYIAAVADIGAGEPVNGFVFCVPKAQTMEQLGDTVKRWIDAHPETRNYAGKGVVAAALGDAYPCPQR